MKKIIALALITSFAVTGTAIARGANGQGGNGGQGAAGDNGAEPVVVRVVRVPPTYQPRLKPQHCHIAGEVAATDYECGHNSR
ncbi:MAG: hypothetical protein AB3N20_14860 [Rhizobiaceae bacterium]